MDNYISQEDGKNALRFCRAFSISGDVVYNNSATFFELLASRAGFGNYAARLVASGTLRTMYRRRVPLALYYECHQSRNCVILIVFGMNNLNDYM